MNGDSDYDAVVRAGSNSKTMGTEFRTCLVHVLSLSTVVGA